MLRSFYDLAFCTQLPVAPEKPITRTLEDPEQRLALGGERMFPIWETSFGGNMKLDKTGQGRHRSSVGFSKSSSSLHMSPIEELSECDSAETPTSLYSLHSNSRSHQKAPSSRLLMGHKSRRRRVHQLLMEDYAHRHYQQQVLTTATMLPTTISPTSPDDYSATSYSDVSSISCDSD
jgi:hypothetical protein